MLDETEENILADVDRHGWSVICVPECAESPSFVYSIGMMHTLDHPEIIVFGLDIDLMWRIINGIADDIRTGRSFADPGLYEGAIEGFACKVRPAGEAHHTTYLGYAMWHRRHVGQIGTLRTVQCLWPDRNGIFPDERGCDPDAVRLHPLF
jgi:hypothetical protein